MDEMFKKLEGYETVGSDKLSEWDKLEAMLPKKRKRRMGWLWIFPGLITLWLGYQNFNTSIEGGNDITLADSFTNSKVFNTHNLLALKSRKYPSKILNSNEHNLSNEIKSDDSKGANSISISPNIDVQSIKKTRNK